MEKNLFYNASNIPYEMFSETTENIHTHNNRTEIKSSEPLPTLMLYIADPELRKKYEDVIHKHNVNAAGAFPDAGFDLFIPKATIKTICECENNTTIKARLGVRSAVYDSSGKPVSYFMYPRSSMGLRSPFRLANSVGIIDSGYRGELCAILDKNSRGKQGAAVDENTRLVQLCSASLEPFTVSLVDSEDDLHKTDRMEGGFGSTGGTLL